MAEETARSKALADEQRFVDIAYDALDRQRQAYETRLTGVRAQKGIESAGEMSERDSFASHYEDNLVRLRNVENRLVMGRLDFSGGQVEHIGRIGLKDDNQNILLLDWRAPQAEPFYQATAVNPGNVVRRRHIQTRFRQVTGVEDELLNTDKANEIDDLNLTGEGALMAALNAARDGKMSDIVATIQAEQDRIIRADSSGVLIVQGGPGTGKTAVALHRAAYLLYSQRARLSRSGVLVIGPSPVFLRYIDQVLPSLGESDIVSTTMSELLPGIQATGSDTREAARIKGKLVWRAIAKRAVRTIVQKPLKSPVSFEVDGVLLTLTPQAVENAQSRARRGGRPHNEARQTYAKTLVDELSAQLAHAKETNLETSPWIVSDVANSIDARREINLRWLPSSPLQLLERLYARPHLLESVAPELTAEERAALLRPQGSPVTEADIPILDELAELLGDFRTDAERHRIFAAQTAEAELNAYVKETMSSLHLGGGIVDAAMLSDRVRSGGPLSSLAEQAAMDRTWTYGHIVVDEAQELSPMQWEMLVRRCPSRSMTVVGDLDQRPEGAPEGGWLANLGRIGDNAREERLTVSYRTPSEVLDAAGRVLEASGHPVRTVRAARSIPGSLTLEYVDSSVSAAIVDNVLRWCAIMDDDYGSGAGNIAIIAPDKWLEPLGEALGGNDLSSWSVNVNDTDITARVHLLSAFQTKGLEYDVVLLVDPRAILEEGPGNLYVAMTRPTRHLHVIHRGDLPEGF